MNVEKDIMVSVYCMTYNHAKYIRDALNGFVMQKTNFKYEVIVHDDASTDGTADIIREYAEKYPDIIKPIIQTENQYSKGRSGFKKFVLPKLTGKYIASCEGDDCWTDENKLQVQFDFMENNKDFVLCTHNTEFLKISTNEKFVRYPTEDTELFLKDVLRGSSGYHTSSLFYRSEYLYNRPDFVSAIPGVGDLPLAIYFALSGRIMRFGKVMSLYRCGVEGSWTLRIEKNREQNLKFIKKSITMLNMADEYSEYRYHELFYPEIVRSEYRAFRIEGKYKELKDKKYKEFYDKEKTSVKIRMFVVYYFPIVTKIKKLLRKIKVVK